MRKQRTTEDIQWHYTSCSKDGMLRHPSRGSTWKSFDICYPEFASNHVRHRIASDGFNPFRMLNSAYSSWLLF